MGKIETIYEEIRTLSESIVKLMTEKKQMLSTAESCTGGMISGAVTAIPGSSAVIELGVCSYSNRIKSELLHVSEQTLSAYTEYSLQCAEEMARGAMGLADSDFGVSTTGIAGPEPLNEQHPAGEVYIAVCSRESCVSRRYVFDNDSRDCVRAMAALTALKMLYDEFLT